LPRIHLCDYLGEIARDALRRAGRRLHPFGEGESHPVRRGSGPVILADGSEIEAERVILVCSGNFCTRTSAGPCRGGPRSDRYVRITWPR